MKAPIVPRDIVDAIRAHQDDAIRPGREIVGKLIVEGGRVVRYERMRNWARGDGRFRCGPVQEPNAILVHSHPSPNCGAHPSRGDLRGAHERWLGNLYAIFYAPGNILNFYVLHHDRKGYDFVSQTQEEG